MRQFDVFANPSERASANVPFVIVLQSDLVHQTKTVVIAPLVAADSLRDNQILYPFVEVEGRRVAITITELATAPRSVLKTYIVGLERERERIITALDILFTGF